LSFGEHVAVKGEHRQETNREGYPEGQVRGAAGESLIRPEERSVADGVREEPEVEADGKGGEVPRLEIAGRC